MAERSAALAYLRETNAHTYVLKDTTIYVLVNSTTINALISPLNSFQGDLVEILEGRQTTGIKANNIRHLRPLVALDRAFFVYLYSRFCQFEQGSEAARSDRWGG